MKKIFTGTLALLLLVAGAQAQDKQQRSRDSITKHEYKRPHKKAHQKEHDKDVNLTADQKAKLKALNEKHKQERDAILTKEQKAKLAESRKQEARKLGNEGRRFDTSRMHAHKGAHADSLKRKGKFGSKKAPANAQQQQAMRKALQLSDSQEKQIATIRESYKAKFTALRNDSSLSQQQKKQRAEELQKAQQQEIKAVLTPEQQEKAKGLMSKRRK